jgi:hypothetical protein
MTPIGSTSSNIRRAIEFIILKLTRSIHAELFPGSGKRYVY